MDEHDPADARDIARATVKTAIDRVERLAGILRNGGAPTNVTGTNAFALHALEGLSDVIDEWKT